MTSVLVKDIVHVVLFALAWVNSILVASGHKPIPAIDDNQVSWCITFVVSVWSMVRDNPFKRIFASKPSEAPVVPVVPSEAPAVPAPTPVAPVAPVAVEAQPAEPRAPEPAPAEAVQAETAPAADAPKAN